jgi:hypothetical protein
MNDTDAARLAEIREHYSAPRPPEGATKEHLRFLLRLLDAAQAEVEQWKEAMHKHDVMRMTLHNRILQLEQALGEAHSIIGSNLLHDALGPITQWYDRTCNLLGVDK